MLEIVKNGLTLIINERKIPVFGIMCLLITAAILIAGLWPFNFHPPNKVEWLRGGPGIRFFGQGMVYGPKPLTAREADSKNVTVSIELLISPYKEDYNGVPSILTLFNHNLDKFIIGQWKTSLIIRVPAAKEDSKKRYREIGIANVLKKDSTHLITVASQRETTNIYVDGKLRKSFARYFLIHGDEGLSGHLILGNSPEGNQSWNGAFLGLAVYDHSLSDKEALVHYYAWQKLRQPLASDVQASLQADGLASLSTAKSVALYLFDDHGEQIQDLSGNNNNLVIPAIFQPLRRIILGVPAKDQWFSRSNLKDVTINILGFVPFGFFLPAWLGQAKKLSSARVYGITIFTGSFLSLAIELTQVYLPTRDSSLLDVINNILGTAAGALLLNYAARFFINSKKTA